MDALTRLKQAVDAYYPLSQETWSAIAAITSIKLLAKDEWLYKEGEYLTTFAFLHQGLVRLVNTNAAGQEYNKRFFVAGEFVAAWGIVWCGMSVGRRFMAHMVVLVLCAVRGSVP